MTVCHMCIACWVPKASNTHSEYVIFTALHSNNGCKKVSQCYVVRTLPVLFVADDSSYLHVLKFGKARNSYSFVFSHEWYTWEPVYIPL